MDTKLSFNNHIIEIVKSSHRNLGFLIRNSQNFKKQKTLNILFNSLVRSKLEYSCVIWSPYYKKYIEKIEKIQSKFLKCSKYITRGQNEFADINLMQPQCLEKRRNFHKITFLYKLINNFIDDSNLLSNIYLLVPSRVTRSKNVFFTIAPRTNYIMTAPLNSMCSLCNEFATSSLFSCKGIIAFKTAIKRILFSPSFWYNKTKFLSIKLDLTWT